MKANVVAMKIMFKFLVMSKRLVRSPSFDFKLSKSSAKRSYFDFKSSRSLDARAHVCCGGKVYQDKNES